jgi:NAD(P)-dependent dehydrogenase (short-subunit alcohol dehydrogenase family)
MRPLDEQTIMITGATDGLGRALALGLAAGGAAPLLHAATRPAAGRHSPRSGTGPDR